MSHRKVGWRESKNSCLTAATTASAVGVNLATVMHRLDGYRTVYTWNIILIDISTLVAV